MKRAVITGVGSYLPKNIVTNKDLESRIETNDAWIVERTGIRQRHIAAEGEYTSHLASNAAREALQAAGVNAKDIDLVIVATTTPDDTIPATAVKVQHALGITKGGAFDIQAACSGFVYGLATADAYIRAGLANNALVIGAETFSRVVDWNDRTTCILFGDGAGAVVVQAKDGKGDTSDRGILSTVIHSDGAHLDILKTNGGVSTTGTAGTLFMAGKEVFRHAVSKMAEATEEALKAASVDAGAVEWVIPHQANWRILSATAQKLGIAEEKVISTVERHANTSAASIPLALSEAVKEGKIKQGQMLALPALGAGLTWGSCILRW